MLGVNGAWGGLLKGTEFTEPGASLRACYAQGQFRYALGWGVGRVKEGQASHSLLLFLYAC